ARAPAAGGTAAAPAVARARAAAAPGRAGAGRGEAAPGTARPDTARLDTAPWSTARPGTAARSTAAPGTARPGTARGTAGVVPAGRRAVRSADTRAAPRHGAGPNRPRPPAVGLRRPCVSPRGSRRVSRSWRSAPGRPVRFLLIRRPP